MKTTHHAHQGRNQKRSVGGARVKKIKCPGKKNIIFYCTNFIFQRTKGVPGRRPAPTLVPPLMLTVINRGISYKSAKKRNSA
jgi:hypothetical protein